MKEELLNKKVMVMYDIRDIQKYIFNTNKVRDIRGASILVDNLLKNGMEECCKKNPSIKPQEQFIGGGNACYLYQTGKDAETINRALATWILEETFSLQLAIAVVEKTDRYDVDYENLQKEMARIKMKMTKTALFGALPIVVHEEITGLPVSETIQGPEGVERVSAEIARKRRALYKNDFDRGIKFDDMVEQKEENSTLAVVHIDGNSMGKRIKGLMENETDYDKAMIKMKRISDSINISFEEAFDQMKNTVTKWAEETPGEDAQKCYVRQIIRAGDDITFVCTGKLALSLVEIFVHALKDKVMYFNEGDENTELAEYGFSVCAGIAYMYSHFPFSDAYQIAEKCCENAKKKAKEKERKIGGIIGNWVDFQVCREVQSVYLKHIRRKNYYLSDGGYLLKRPYYIPYINQQYQQYQKMNEINEQYSFEHLKNQLKYINFKNSVGRKTENSKMTDSDWKELRNAYSIGKDAVEELLTFLASRDKRLYSEPFDEDGIAQWYDALEICELYTVIEK